MPTQEVWKYIVGYEGCYQVSNTGRVRTVDRKAAIGGGLFRKVRSRVLKSAPLGKKNYRVVNLSVGNKQRVFLVHWLVLEAFVGSRPVGMYGLHKDDNPANNNLNNLYWGSLKDNARDALENKKLPTGENHHLAKSTNEEVREVRRLYQTGRFSQKELANRFGRSFVWVHNVVHYKKWKHI